MTGVLLIAIWGAHYVSPPQFICPPTHTHKERAALAWPLSLHSHDAGLNILTDALMVVMVIIWPASRGMERRNAIKVEDEIFSVTHGGRVVLVPRQSH